MMGNSANLFVVVGLICCFSFPFVSTMITKDCEEDKLILPITQNSRSINALPDTLIPRHYTLEFQPFLPPNGNSSFAGHAKISIRCGIPSSYITLHSFKLKIFEPTVRVISIKDRRVIKVTRIEYNLRMKFVVIHLNSSLQPGDEYNVSMRYLGSLKNKQYGFYQSSYRDINDTTPTWLALTTFKPTGARWAFPCFDEPDLKATFDVILIRPSTLYTLSNMPILKSENRSNGFVADYHSTTKPMSTYLLCFFFSDFNTIRRKRGLNYEHRLWFRLSSYRFANDLRDMVLGMKPFLENYFKISYPLPQIDVIAIPDFEPHVVESYGVITMRESYLYRRELTPWSAYMTICQTLAHGLAHQWFGNLVTMKWWNDVWLNEGFATYFADHVVNNFSATYILEKFYVLHNIVALEKDCLETTRALSSPAQNDNEIKNKFNDITRHKGACLIRMMKHILSEPILNMAVHKYLKANAYSNTVQDDLWYYISMVSKAHSKINVKEVMDTWTLQEGYPVVTIIRNYESQTATVSQKRFLIGEKTKKSSKKNAELWHIPITFTTKVRSDFRDTKVKFWLSDKGENLTLQMENGVPLKDEWMIFNIKAIAYCITNYDTQNWNLLINAVKTGRIEDYGFINLAQLIHDSFILARARELDYSIPLQLAFNVFSNESYREVHYLSWKTFGIAASQLSYKLKSTEMYRYWNDYIVQIISPIITKYGKIKVIYNHLQSLQQEVYLELAIKAGKNDTTVQAAEIFKQLMNNSMIVHYAIQEQAACAGIRNGGEAEFQFAFNEYLDSTWPSDKSRLLSHLNCVTNDNHLKLLLEMALNPYSRFRKQDFNQLFSIVTSSIEGKPVAISFIRNNLQKIKNIFKVETKAKIRFMLSELARSFSTTTEFQQMERLIKDVKTTLKYKEDFKGALKVVDDNIIWMKTSYKSITNFLKKHFH